MALSTISGQSHVVLRHRVVDTPEVPFGWTVRLLFLVEEGESKPRPFWPLYDYMAAKWALSDAWQANIARSIGLFWDFLVAKYRVKPADFSKAIPYRSLLRGFASALLNGTVEYGCDPLGLYWSPQPVIVANRIAEAIDGFFLWLSLEKGEGVLASRTWRGCESLCSLGVAKRLNLSIKSYLGAGQLLPRSGVLPNVGGSRGPEAAISFPAYAVENVLWDGFRRHGAKTGGWDDFYVDAMMIFLLQAFAGAREHEPHHLWITDVVEDPSRMGQAHVMLYHPVLGYASLDGLDGSQVRTTRREYLKAMFGLPPRTYGTGSYRIGWKRSAISGRDHSAVLFWADPTASMLFLELFRYYTARRAIIMKRREGLGLPLHPFLFVSEQEARNLPDGYKSIGAPASIESYENRLARAVRRVGMPYAKEFGTTSHGARHLYAQTIRKLGVGRKTLQSALRHRHPGSSDRYGIPLASEISDALNKAQSERPSVLPDGLRLHRTYEYIVSKHLEYDGGIL